MSSGPVQACGESPSARGHAQQMCLLAQRTVASAFAAATIAMFATYGSADRSA